MGASCVARSGWREPWSRGRRIHLRSTRRWYVAALQSWTKGISTYWTNSSTQLTSCIFRVSPGPEPRATKRFYGILYAAFPDLRHTVVEQISTRNKVVTRWTARGTHRADWMGIAATGKRVSFGGINIYTVRRGRLAESHVNWDILGLAQQLSATSFRLQYGGKRTSAAS